LIPRPTRTPVLLTSPARRIATLALVGLGACAPRGVPSTFVTTPPAAESPPPRVAVMLAEDPPLPGEDTSLWPGLEPADAPVADPHAHHRHPPSAGSPAPTPAAPQAAAAAPKAAAKPMNAGAALTVEEAVRLALHDNRALRASLLELGIAKGQLVQAGVLPNPELEVELFPRQEGVEHTRVSLGLDFDLTALLLAPIRESAAGADVESARLRAAGDVVAMGYAARAAFRAVQASEQRLAIANRALDAFAAARDASRALFEAGNITELDAATQDAAYETARVTSSELELELLDRREALQRVLGLSGAKALRVSGTLPKAPAALPPMPEVEAKALAASLELAELRSRLDGVSRRSGLARTVGALPDVSIGVRGEREETTWAIGGALTMALPIFDRKQGSAAAYAAEHDSLLERHEGLVADLRSAARQARNRLVSSHARARHYEGVVVPARKRVVEQTLLQYNAMQTGIFELLMARRQLLDAELAEIETLREHWTARAAFDALLAGRRVDFMAGPVSAGFAGSGDVAEGGH
jgi:cobalt-zinc-cadmium efflux system outer membrane protein